MQDAVLVLGLAALGNVTIWATAGAYVPEMGTPALTKFMSIATAASHVLVWVAAVAILLVS